MLSSLSRGSQLLASAIPLSRVPFVPLVLSYLVITTYMCRPDMTSWDQHHPANPLPHLRGQAHGLELLQLLLHQPDLAHQVVNGLAAHSKLGVDVDLQVCERRGEGWGPAPFVMFVLSVCSPTPALAASAPPESLG